MIETTTPPAVDVREGPVRAGVRAIVPMTVGVAPFGLALGATVAAERIEPTAGLAASVLFVAGSAQLSTIDMIGQGAPAVATIAAALFINLRFFAYSAGASTWFPTSSRGQRAAIAYPLVDPLYLAVATDTQWDDRTEPERRRFYAGAAVLLLTVWVCAQIVGFLVGGALPDGLLLEYAAPLSIAGLLAKAAGDRSSTTATIVAMLAAGAAVPWLGPSAVLIAIVAATSTTPRRSAP